MRRPMDAPPGRPLENDADDNPCVGCGPRHPFGARLAFHDDGKRTRAVASLDDRYCGFPGAVHDAFVFLAMDEAIAWAGYARFGRNVAGDGESTLYVEKVRTGVPFTVEAWPGHQAGGWWWFVARVVQKGKEVAHLEQRVRPWTDDEARRAADDETMPRSIREDARAWLA